MGRHSTSNEIVGAPRAASPSADATHADLPFAPLRAPVDRSRVALLTGAGVYPANTPPFQTTRPEGWLREIPSDVSIEQLEIDPLDFEPSKAPVDLSSLFPLERLQELEDEGAIGSVAKHHFSLSPWSDPANVGFERALRQMAERCQADGTDIVIGLPVGPRGAVPVTLSLRSLEAAGVPTVLLSIAPEDRQHVRAPRAYHLDFPCHCPLGSPSDRALQRNILLDCLHLLPRLQAGDFVTLPYHWEQSQPS